MVPLHMFRDQFVRPIAIAERSIAVRVPSG